MSHFLDVNVEMLQRYDKPGPRYTSYPTAPHFTESFGSARFMEEIEVTNGADAPADLSLYFHLPFCESLCYFCGCTTIITRNRERIAGYLDYLDKEIELVAARINPQRRVTQLHWGGGTPSYLEPDEIRRLFESIRSHFPFAQDAEVSIEIDPRGMTDAHLDAIVDVGFNRASMGVQDFEPQVQETINRLQSEELTRWVFDGLRTRGIESINLDLIYGLPHQSVASFERTLARIIDISPDRLAVFNYAHVPWLKKHQKIIKEETLPSVQVKLNLLKYAVETLTREDYVFIGMDHFAKPEDSLVQALNEKKLYRNFQGYSTKWGCDLYALGMSGISQLQDVYAQNTKELPDYYEALDEGRLPTQRGYRLTEDDQVRRHVITKIMCEFEIDMDQIEAHCHIDFNAYFADALAELAPFAQDKLLHITDRKLTVTDSGRLLIRNIAMAFDAYLKDDQQKSGPMYSKTL